MSRRLGSFPRAIIMQFECRLEVDIALIAVISRITDELNIFFREAEI
jgi:hypothetical protein